MPYRSSNVLPLRPHAQAPSWRAKLLVVFLYGSLSFFLPAMQPTETIDLVMLLAIAYWALVHHRKHWTAFYTRYHLLQMLLLMVLLAIALGIIGATVNLVFSILPIVGLGNLLASVLFTANFWLSAAMRAVVFILPFGLGMAALLGKNPSLPFISEQARRWA